MSNLAILMQSGSVGTGEIHTINKRHMDSVKSFHVVLTGTGAVSATVIIEVSNDGSDFVSDSISTISISGTNSVSAGRALAANWAFIRARISAISGTGAVVTVRMGS